MESADGDSSISVPGRPVSVSAAYTGRLAVAYQVHVVPSLPNSIFLTAFPTAHLFLRFASTDGAARIFLCRSSLFLSPPIVGMPVECVPTSIGRES